MRRITYIIAILLISVGLYAQVDITADTNIVEFGYPVNIHLTVKANGQKVVFPQFKNGDITPNISIAKEQTDTVKKSPLTVQKTYSIVFFDDSVQTLPPMTVLVGKDTFMTAPLTFMVTSPKIDSTDLAKIDTTEIIPGIDVKEPLTVKFTFREFWLRFGRWIVLALLILAVIAVIVWLIIRYKNNKPVKILERPKEPPYVIALRRLDELKEKKLYQQGLIKEYYSELTDILRTYIEQRFRIAALEQTSTEIINSFKIAKVIDDKQLELLQNLLRTADFAKFAKFKPTNDVNEQNWNLTKEFIENTKQVPQENEEDTEKQEEQQNSDTEQKEEEVKDERN